MSSINTTLYGKQGNEKFSLNPRTIAEQVEIADDAGQASNVESEIIKLRQQINAAVNQGIHFKGVVTQAEPLPSVAYKAGWQYYVGEAGSYVGASCEVGDFIVCIRDYASGSASNADWAVLQANLTGVVQGPATSVASHVAVFDGTAGNKLADSGFMIGKSVPSDAQFTDTTYSPATNQSDGLMTAAEHTKLAGVEAGADKTDETNVAAAGALMKGTDTADDINDGISKVVMTAAERTKLSSVSTGAEVNQNAFSNVKVGDTTIASDGKTATLEIAAGEGVTVTPDAKNRKVTIGEQYVDSCVVTDLENVPANLRDGGLIILKS